MISIASPVIGAEEITAVNEVMQSGMIAQGPKVAQLEEAFAGYCGTKYAVALNSGTAAIHAALFAAGVGPGDEVITTPFSFIATINPILFLGAKPVLVDIELTTYNIDVQKIEKAITPNTKAIMPVHLYGQPCDYAEIRTLANKYELKVIEDACQAIGSTYGDESAGNLGDLGCFSLYATKNIMCGEGGMVTTNSEVYATAIKSFRQHGMVAPYEYAGVGYNYRMTDLHAAIAVEQLKKAGSFNAIRQRNAHLLSEGLKNIKGLVLPITKNGRTHVFHQYTVAISPEFKLDRTELMAALKAKGIGSGIYYPKPLNAYPHIAELGFKQEDFLNAELAASQVLSLPVHQKVTEADVQAIVAAIKEIAGA